MKAMIRFIKTENGVQFLITNYKKDKTGKVEFKKYGCWKWELNPSPASAH